MPLPTTESEISADVMAQLQRLMYPATPMTDRMSVLAAHFRDLKATEAEELKHERKRLGRQDEVWQARADERGEGDEVEA